MKVSQSLRSFQCPVVANTLRSARNALFGGFMPSAFRLPGSPAVKSPTLPTVEGKKGSRVALALSCGALLLFAGTASAQGTLVSGLQNEDIGTDARYSVKGSGSTEELAPGDYDMVAGGADIWDDSDAFQFAYEQVDTPFLDLRVQVPFLEDGVDHWTKAGIMIREDLTPGSPHAMHIVTPAAGQNAWVSQRRVVADGGSQRWPGPNEIGPVEYPDVWLRLVRIQNEFTSYWSTDGEEWTQLGQITQDLPTNAYVGLALTSHNNSSDPDEGLARAEFRNYESVPVDISLMVPVVEITETGQNISFEAEALAPDATFDADGIRVFLNGVDRTGEVTINGEGTSSVSGSLSGLEANRFFLLEVEVEDSEGLVGTASAAFDTMDPEGNFTWEANDWNFEGGQFIDNPGIDWDDDPNYFDKIGTEGVDEHTISDAGNDAYRLGSAVGTEPSGDEPREPWASDDRPDAIQFNVGWVAEGEWLNYTRTFPAGDYNVYGRLARDGNVFFAAQLDRVTSNPAQGDQTTEKLGTFSANGTGGWQNYRTLPLLDDSGNIVTVSLSGVETLRVTAASGGYNANYYMLLPADANPPQIVDVAPQSGTPFADPEEGVTFSVLSETGVDVEGIRVTVNGVDRSGDLVVSGDANARQVSLGGLLPNREQTVEIAATDVDGIANTYPFTGTQEERPVTIDFGTFEKIEYSGSIFMVTDRPDLEEGEAGLAGFLRSIGYEVNVNEENPSEFRGELSAGQISQLEGHDLVVVHRATGSGSFSGDVEDAQWNDLNVPLMLGSAYLARDIRWQWVPGGEASGGVADLEYVDAQHPIVSGLGTSMFSSSRNLNPMSSAEVGNGTLIATVPNGGTALAVWDDPGAFHPDGQSHVERRVFFAIHNYHEAGAWEDISMNGQLLMANVIEYSMTGEVTRVLEDPGVPEPGVPAPGIAWDGNNHVVSWDDAGVTLERTEELTGQWEALEDATSPYTETENTGKLFYRLRAE